MFISNSKRFVFVHITKAAGSSVVAAIDKSCEWNDIALGSTPLGRALEPPYRERFGIHKHSMAREIRAVMGEAAWNDYFTFSFVRNPFSRAVSLYTFVERVVRETGYRRYLPIRRGPGRELWRWRATKAYLATRSFSEFIRHPVLQRDDGMRSQSDWLCDDDGQLMVDFVGQVENIDADFATVAARTGLGQTRLTTENRSAGRQWHDYLSAADYDYLYDLFRRDFELFGYDPEQRS